MKNKMRFTFFLLLFCTIQMASLQAQVSINSTGADPDPSAILDVQSSDKGILIPRMSISQRDAISSPADGLMVYVTDDSSFSYFNGEDWTSFQSAGSDDNESSISLADTFVLSDGICETDVDIPATSLIAAASSRWQSFTPSISGFLCQVSPDLRSPDLDTGFFRVYAGEGTAGELLYEQMVYNLSGTGPTPIITLPSYAVHLEKDSLYTIYLEDTVNNFRWVAEFNGTYPGGRSSFNAKTDMAVKIDMVEGEFITIDDIINAASVANSDGDRDSTNEIQSLGFANHTLSLTNGNSVDLSAYNQSLQLSGNNLFITDGNSVTLPVYNQDLQLSGTTLSISDGNSVTLPTYNQDLQLSGTTLSITDGNSVNLNSLTLAGDDLGNHQATANLQLKDYYLSNDGGNEGIKISDDGKVAIGLGSNSPEALLHLEGELRLTNSNLEFNTGYSGSANNRIAKIKNELTAGSYSPDDQAMVFEVSDGGLGTTDEIMRLRGDGHVGIGTSNPRAPLHVQGTSTILYFNGANNGGAWMMESSGSGTDEINWANNAGSTPVSIYASGSIVADGEGVFVAATVNWSDARIKNIMGISDAQSDLETLQAIEVTDYRRIDGGKLEKKLIAQQLREIFPQAVSLREGVIPSIYEHIENFNFDDSNKQLIINTQQPHDLKVGDHIDYYTELEKHMQEEVIAVISPTQFVVSSADSPEQLFVFGKWVKDVHVVDYDAVSMLNVSATQELARENKMLKSELEALKKLVQQLAQEKNMTLNK